MAVKSAERVLRIFELLEKSTDGMTNKEISEELHFAPSSTLSLLQTLADNGYLSMDEQKKYFLGGRLVSLGAVTASRFNIGKMAAPYLKNLMQTLEETCFLGVLSDGEIVYIAKENCDRTINTNAQIGSRKPVYCTGLGKAFLAFLPQEESDEIIDRLEFKKFTEGTVSDAASLKEQLKTFRRLGYAIDNQEIEEGLWCLAVPIYDGYHKMIAAISVSGPKDRMMKKKDIIIEKMAEASRNLSRELGY